MWEDKYPDIQLNFLTSEALINLKNNDYAAIPKFIHNSGWQESLLKELNFIEKDGRMEEQVQEASVRSDKILW